MAADESAPLATVAYYDDAPTTEPWMRVVRLFGVSGLILGGSDIAFHSANFLPYLNGGASALFQRQNRLAVALELCGMAVSVVLVMGSLGCLARARFARQVMLAYAVSAIVFAGISALLRPMSLLRAGFGGPLTELYLRFAINAVGNTAIPILVIGMMRHPAITRLFRRG